MAPVSRRALVGDNLTRWLLYGVLVSLLPLIVHVILAYLHTPRSANVWRILGSTIGDGELLLIACSISASALGERVGRQSTWPRMEALFAVACLVWVVIDTLTYGTIHAGAIGRRSLVPKISLVFFGLSVLCSAVLMAITFVSRAEGVK